MTISNNKVDKNLTELNRILRVIRKQLKNPVKRAQTIQLMREKWGIE